MQILKVTYVNITFLRFFRLFIKQSWFWCKAHGMSLCWIALFLSTQFSSVRYNDTILNKLHTSFPYNCNLRQLKVSARPAFMERPLRTFNHKQTLSIFLNISSFPSFITKIFYLIQESIESSDVRFCFWSFYISSFKQKM